MNNTYIHAYNKELVVTAEEIIGRAFSRITVVHLPN